MSSGKTWISMGFHEGRVTTIVKNMCGEKGDYKSEKGDGPGVRMVRTPLGKQFKCMKSEQGWLVFREGKG